MVLTKVVALKVEELRRPAHQVFTSQALRMGGLSAFGAGIWPQAQKYHAGDGPSSIDGLQNIGHAIGGELHPECRGQVRDYIDVARIAKGVTLHSPNALFREARR